MQTRAHYTARAGSLCFRTDCWIGGRPVPAASGARFASVNPATGSSLAEVARGGAADIDRAVASARAAFEDGRWAGRTPAARKDVLLRLAALIRDNLEELALVDTLDMGKPITETVSVDVPGSAHFFQWHSEAIDTMYGEIAPTGRRDLAMIRRVPLGVVGAVVPCLDVSDRLVAGTVTVNTVEALSALTPFGGMKQSGFGRDLSLHSFDKYSALKTVWIRY